MAFEFIKNLNKNLKVVLIEQIKILNTTKMYLIHLVDTIKNANNMSCEDKLINLNEKLLRFTDDFNVRICYYNLPLEDGMLDRIKFYVKKFTKTKLQEMIKDQESQYKEHRSFCKNAVEKISKLNKDYILLNSLLEELIIWLKDNKILFNEPIPSSKVIE